MGRLTEFFEELTWSEALRKWVKLARRLKHRDVVFKKANSERLRKGIEKTNSTKYTKGDGLA